MSRVYFYPDISYQEIKTIERQFNSNNNEYLINKASDFIFDVISCEQSKSNRILFICGPGSNGLDGVYSACKLKLNEYRVNIFLCDSSIDTSYIKKCGLSEIIISNPTLNQFDCIVDCIFGYGINRDLSDSYIKLINSINSTDVYTYSIDIPSGLHPETGKLCPVSVKCNCLISLMTYKRGIFTYQGKDTWECLRHSTLIDIKFDKKNYLISANQKMNGSLYEVNYSQTHIHSQHKKSNGICCIIAGEKPYHGSLILSTMGAFKSGCRYIHAFTDEEYAHTLPMIIPEVIAESFSIENFENNLRSFKNILIGPGTNDVSEKYIDIISNNLKYLNSIVVDAGALKYLKRGYSYSNKVIITPHPGEAASLLNISSDEVQKDRYQAARKLNQLFDCIIILKGSGTIIYDGVGFYTCMDGNSRMGVAGMGDILSGILMCELASSSHNIDACIKAVTFHSHSGDYLFNNKVYNFLPSMIADTYSNLVNE